MLARWCSRPRLSANSSAACSWPVAGGSPSAGSRASAAAVASIQRSAAAASSGSPSQGEQVRLIALVIDRDDAVGEQEEGVGQLGAVGGGGAAVGLALVAEVAHEAAVEVERELWRGGVQARELA